MFSSSNSVRNCHNHGIVLTAFGVTIFRGGSREGGDSAPSVGQVPRFQILETGYCYPTLINKNGEGRGEVPFKFFFLNRPWHWSCTWCLKKSDPYD